MLLALLYCDEDRIAAAAMACDQYPYGDQYWNDVFEGRFEKGEIFETAYVMVNNASLRRKLFQLGFDEQVDGRALAAELAASFTPDYLPRAA